MSELSFLIELLLNHDLPKATKDILAERIKEVEANLVSRPAAAANAGYVVPPGIRQAPSTLALMAKHGDFQEQNFGHLKQGGQEVVEQQVVPPEQIAQTPATAAAMNSRNEAINQALSGKVDKVSGKPRKW